MAKKQQTVIKHMLMPFQDNTIEPGTIINVLVPEGSSYIRSIVLPDGIWAYYQSPAPSKLILSDNDRGGIVKHQFTILGKEKEIPEGFTVRDVLDNLINLDEMDENGYPKQAVVVYIICKK